MKIKVFDKTAVMCSNREWVWIRCNKINWRSLLDIKPFRL